jgi:hypothetical protein
MRVAWLPPPQRVGGATWIALVGRNVEMKSTRSANADADDRLLMYAIRHIFPDIEARRDTLRWEPGPVVPAKLVGQSTKWNGKKLRRRPTNGKQLPRGRQRAGAKRQHEAADQESNDRGAALREEHGKCRRENQCNETQAARGRGSKRTREEEPRHQEQDEACNIAIEHKSRDLDDLAGDDFGLLRGNAEELNELIVQEARERFRRS